MLKTVFTHLYNYRIWADYEQIPLVPQLQTDSGTELLPICESKFTLV
jgi:hypothetical protein